MPKKSLTEKHQEAEHDLPNALDLPQGLPTKLPKKKRKGSTESYRPFSGRK